MCVYSSNVTFDKLKDFFCKGRLLTQSKVYSSKALCIAVQLPFELFVLLFQLALCQDSEKRHL